MEWMQRHFYSTGFSLVELSIVLVILGLLTGGILAGQSLIRAAELRAVNTEYSRYRTAVGTFRDKYFALPGDINNATSFWGTAGTCPGNSASPSTTAATCNGDGDGLIMPNAANSNEEFRFWQHLANAGLIEGSYNGVANSTTASSNITLIGTNVPKSKMSSGGWSVENQSVYPISSTILFEGNYGNVLYFGSQATSWVTINSILKPEEAWNIDTKMDDGKPATGTIRTLEGFAGTSVSTGCSDTAASTTASLTSSNYSLQNTSVACSFIMTLGY